jgi:predicted permease
MSADIRHALRALRATPGFTAVAVLCLALGVGANAAIFALLDAAMLRPLPVADPDRLIVVQTVRPSATPGSSFSHPEFAYLRQHAAPAAELFAYSRIDLNLSTGDVPDAPAGLAVSDNYFAALGLQPAVGRLLSAGDDSVVVISHRYWQTRFGGDPAVAGQAVALNGVPLTVAGVAPPRFFGTEVGRWPDVFVPIGARERVAVGGPRLSQPNSFWLRVMGRLRPDITMEQATSQLAARYQQYATDQAGVVPPTLQRLLQQRRVVLASGARGPYGIGERFGTPLRILMTVVCLVLLIACANVASLLLARASGRRREIAIRFALGARRVRIVRQFLAESLVLATLGGAGGLLFGIWSANALAAFLQDSVLDVSPDARVLAFTLGVSLLTACLFGVAPALGATRGDLTPAFRSDGSGAVSGRRGRGRLLVPIQVALSLLLAISAGLFIRTLTNLRTMDAGFQGDRVLLATVNPGLSRYPRERVRIFYDALASRVGALPGVHSVSVADAPLLGGTFIDGLRVEGSDEEIEISIRIVGPRFFETMGIRLLAGRDFLPADTGTSPKVVIVNETIARRFFQGGAIGRRVDVNGAPGTEVIGVAADARYRGLRDAVPNTVYVPLEQSRFLGSERTLHVRTAGNPAGMMAAVRAEVHALDRSLPAAIRPFSHLIDKNLERERLVATLCGFFAGLALLLMSIGLYGVIAHGVQRRTREIGIRISIGARRADVLWMVLRESLGLVSLGIAAGIPLSFWLLKIVAGQLFGVTATDPLTIAGATLVLLIAAAVAGYLPARRAARVDPLVALRHE